MDIIIFGNVPLASWLIEELTSTTSLNLLGVVYDDFEKDAFDHHGIPYPAVNTVCEKLGIKRIDFDEAQQIATENSVLGISVRYHKLFKKDYFESFRPGIINLHGGELPLFRGTNIANHAILQGVEKGAGTLHFIDEGVDCGDIVIREFFDVEDDYTAFDFFTQTLSALQKASTKLLGILQNGEPIPRVKQEYYINVLGEKAHEYKKKDLDSLKIITSDDFALGNVDRKVRAFTFGEHGGAYIQEGNNQYSIKKVVA
jgi:UDP-4-amino-4-deoxy-L-arabinose formyltransferase/UDP-glucuronic acid dehydrogenase (UDP-4-keto-hexauronic acid decarboxylating)